MNTIVNGEASSCVSSRRRFLATTATLSEAPWRFCWQQCAGASRTRHGGQYRGVGILNVALGLEHEAINAYQLGASKWLAAEAGARHCGVVPVAPQGASRALIATIQKLGGKPVEEKSSTNTLRHWNAGALKNQADVLDLAARPNWAPPTAYLGVIPSFKDTALAKAAARPARRDDALVDPRQRAGPAVVRDGAFVRRNSVGLN